MEINVKVKRDFVKIIGIIFRITPRMEMHMEKFRILALAVRFLK